MTPSTTPPLAAIDAADDVQLQSPHGELTAHVRTNWVNGRTLYEVAGPRMSGALTVVPDMSTRANDVMPGSVEVLYGDLLDGDIQARPGRHHWLKNPTTVNGVAVVGSDTTTIYSITDGQFHTAAQRHGSERSDGRLSDAAQKRLTSLAGAVLQHWLARTDLQALQLVIARACIPAILGVTQGKIQELQEKIDALAGELKIHRLMAKKFDQFLNGERNQG